MSEDTWQKLGEVTERITNRLGPVTFTVELDGPVAVALFAHAMKTHTKPEVIIAESARAYLGDA